MTSQKTHNFRRVLSSAERGERLIPALYSYLYNPRFPSFDIHIEGFDQRQPDGLFHPSTHPLWPERMLYWYLVAPSDFINEPMDPTGTLAVTRGKFWHLFLQHCLVDMDELEVAEYHVEDAEAGSSGDLDGVLRPSGPWPREGWEFKTANVYKLQKIVDLESFMVICPDYYAQAEEYLRMSGFTQMRVLLLNPEYPFPMKEVVVPYDPGYALGVRAKYLRVRQCVADGTMPDPCCLPRSDEAQNCPARGVCPVGMA